MADSDNESSGHRNDGSGGNSELSPREQDRFLPIANVSRIMKKALPANAKISKEAKETVQECVSEFISFITGEASDKCQREKRKTINGDDLIWAMTTLGFEEYVEPLKVYLQRFRDLEGDKIVMAGRQEKEVGDGNGSTVNMGNTGGGYAGGQSGMMYGGGGAGGGMGASNMTIGHFPHRHHHQGQAFGSYAGYPQITITRPGKAGSGYHGSGSPTKTGVEVPPQSKGQKRSNMSRDRLDYLHYDTRDL